MNPAVHLYRAWHEVLRLKVPDLHSRRARARYEIGRYSGVFVSAFDQIDRPVLGFGYPHYREWCGDVLLWADGSFQVKFYDADLKRACNLTFLGWGYAAHKRVLFYQPTDSFEQPNEHSPETFVPYFRWKVLPRETRLHLVPDPDAGWRIAIHPESPNHALAQRLLDHEYGLAADRYLRAIKRYRRIQNAADPEQVARKRTKQIEAITLALDPYQPARRPKEEAHEQDRMATRP